MSEGPEEAFQWKLEPWTTGLFTEKQPTVRNSFLEHWLTTCNPIPNSKVLHYVSTGIRWDRDWAPIQSLIARLDRLEQLDFFTQNEFTGGIAEAISHYHPNCKVNIIWRQAIAYSVLDKQTREQLNPHGLWSKYEFDTNVLQLPGLHFLAVDLLYKEYPSAGGEVYDEILPLLVNAPGLKHLELQSTTNNRRFPIARLREKSQALMASRPSSQVSPLESITIPRTGPRENILFKLAAAGNLSNLRTLVLQDIYDPTGLVKIAGLFPNLERLFIDPNPRGLPWKHLKTDHDDSIFAIRAFPALKYLCLYNLRSAENLLRIVERHGPLLKGLIVEPSGLSHSEYPRLDVSLIIQLATYCPSLQELRLQIQRSMGSQAECELYRALGEFPSLHSLVLDLQIDARPEIPLKRFDTEDLTVLRKTFINAATDEKLAIGIWNTIKSNKAFRLQYLRVVPFGNNMFCHEESYLLDCLTRSILVTRYNVHNPLSPSAEEIGSRAREIRRDQFRPAILSERLRRLLHDIWPQVPEGSDWWSGWDSFPLEAETA
jgi:hypothetical protein